MRVSLLLLSVLLVTVVYSVTECHHEKILEKHFEENPGAWEEHQELMKRSMELSRSKRTLSEAADLVRIPVVFHVFFTTSNMDMRLTTEAIEQELIYINDWFNNRNVYFSNSSPFWVDDIATADDMKIQIELAGFDPNGDPTTGIVYYEVDDSFDCSDISQVTSTSEGGIDNWDPFSYMNFRTCDLTGFGAGYASVPLSNSNPATDTVVITYDQIGNPTYSGSTGAHEIGHWLGLYHTFGAGDGCSTTDFVDDTPVTSMPMANFVINNNLGHCPGDDGATDATFITCTEPAMAQNVMDYNFEECISYFSKGQAALMREWLDSDNLGSIRFALRQTAGLADLVTPSSTPAASPSASATRTAAASVSSTSAASASSTSGASASSTPVSSVSSTSGASASSTPDAVVASVSSTSAASASSTSGASASSTPDAVVASVSSTSGASASSTPVAVAASASNTPVASASSTSAASASSITGVITSASSTPAASASSTSAASASQSTAQEYDDDDDDDDDVDYSVETRNLYTDDDDDDDSSVDSDDESLYSTIASDDDDDIVVVTVETNYLYTDDDDDESSDSTLEISSDDDDESSATSDDDDGDDDSPLSSSDDDNSSSSASSHFPMGELIMMTTLFAFI